MAILIFGHTEGVESSWLVTLGGTGHDIGYAIDVNDLGTIVVGGDTRSGLPNRDILIATYDNQGAIQLQRTLGDTSYHQYCYGVNIDSSGNLYGTGYTDTGATGHDIFTYKYNSSGVLQWQRRLSGSGGNADRGRAIDVDSSGNVYIVGEAQIVTNEQAIIAKYNSSGALQWQRTLGDTSGTSDRGRGVAVDGSGNVYVTGFTVVSGTVASFIAKYNTSGTLQWQRTLDAVTYSDFGNSVAVTPSGTVYIAGTQGGFYDSIFVAKYNTSGTIQWQRNLAGGNTDQGNSIAIDSSENVYIACETSSEGEGGTEWLLAKYNSSGTIQWQNTLGGSSGETVYGVATDGTSVYTVEFTDTMGAGGVDYALVSVPADGSGQGTLGSWTYQTSTLTDSAGNLTDAAGTMTSATSTLTDNVGSATSSTSSLTSTIQ